MAISHPGIELLLRPSVQLRPNRLSLGVPCRPPAAGGGGGSRPAGPFPATHRSIRGELAQVAVVQCLPLSAAADKRVCGARSRRATGEARRRWRGRTGRGACALQTSISAARPAEICGDRPVLPATGDRKCRLPAEPRGRGQQQVGADGREGRGGDADNQRPGRRPPPSQAGFSPGSS